MRLFAANWKMHGTPTGLAEFCEKLLGKIPAGPEVVLCPPFPLLPAAVMWTAGSPVAVGAQNCHWAQEGAFTGEVSPFLLWELGVRWVIVGHSERRQLFGETETTALWRAKGAQQAGLSVIYCVGETWPQREEGSTEAVIEQQLSGVGELSPSQLAVAYEPVWAIGTGKNAHPEQIAAAHQCIRRQLGQWGVGFQGVRVLYGGSVKPANAAEILATPGVDGVLVGGASLDAESFCAIITAAP